MTNIQKLESAISGWLDALVADAINPRPDYSIDGQTVSRAQWRESLLKNIKTASDLLNILDPYEFRSFVV